MDEITLETYDRPGSKKYFAKFIYWSVAEFVRFMVQRLCEDLKRFSKGFSQDEPEVCQILI